MLTINQSISDFLKWPKFPKPLQCPLKCHRQKDCCNKNVFKWRLKDCNVGAETMCSGREFEIWSTATGKARIPTVVSLTGGTANRLVPAEVYWQFFPRTHARTHSHTHTQNLSSNLKAQKIASMTKKYNTKHTRLYRTFSLSRVPRGYVALKTWQVPTIPVPLPSSRSSLRDWQKSARLDTGSLCRGPERNNSYTAMAPPS